MHGSRAFAATIMLGFVLAGASIAGCTPAGEETPPDISGVVSSVEVSESGTVTMLVEAPPPVAAGALDKAAVYVSGETTIETADGERAYPDDITVGSEVDVWFTGPVRESYPVQADAKRVVLK